MNKNEYNSDEDPNMVEFDLSKFNSKEIKTWADIPIKTNLPAHIDKTLEKELSMLMDSIKFVCMKRINLFNDIRPAIEADMRVSLVKEIKNKMKFPNELNHNEQIEAVKSIIHNYLFYIDVVIAIVTGDKEKLETLYKFDKTKYDDKHFIEAQKLANQKQIKYDDALLQVYTNLPNIPPELKDNTTSEFLKASNAFKKWRSRNNKRRLNKLSKK